MNMDKGRRYSPSGSTLFIQEIGKRSFYKSCCYAGRRRPNERTVYLDDCNVRRLKAESNRWLALPIFF